VRKHCHINAPFAGQYVGFTREASPAIGRSPPRFRAPFARLFTDEVTHMPRSAAEMPDLSKDVLTALAASAAAAAEAATRINDEILEFRRQRFENDAGIAEAMLDVESFADILKLQRDFMVSVIESYAEETSKLGTMAMDMTKDVTGEIVGRLSRPAA
jgi:hypothetical protein